MSTSISNYAFLFDSSSSSSSSLSSLLGDYSLIKSGSYKKLLSAYYTKTDSTSDSDSTSSTTSTDTTEKTKLISTKSAADSLEDAADALNTSSLYRSTGVDENGEATYDRDKITSAVKEFVSAYNSYIDSASDVDDTSVLSKSLSAVKTTASNSSLLSEVGITIGTSNHLVVDEDKLSTASVSTLKSLFKGSGSYGDTISQRASETSKLAYSAAYSGSSSSYTYSGTYTSLGSSSSSMLDELL